MGTRQEVLVELGQTIEKVVVEIAVNLTAELIERTPVDLGWARANWVPSLSAPFTGGAGPAPKDAGGLAALAQDSGRAELFTFTLGAGPVFVTNNVPYVQRLNDGSSSQAPAGFVEASLDKVLAAARAE